MIKVNPLVDPPGTQLRKLFAFMDTFIGWRRTIHTTPSIKPSIKPNDKPSRKPRAKVKQTKRYA